MASRSEIHDLYAQVMGEPSNGQPADVTGHSTATVAPSGSDAVERCRRYLEKMGDSIQGQDGSGRLFAACCKAVEFGLSEGEVWEVMAWFNQAKCSPPWSERELQHKIEDAFLKTRPDPDLGSQPPSMKKRQAKPVHRTDAVDVGADSKKGQPFEPMVAARSFLSGIMIEGVPGIRRWKEDWFVWSGQCWQQIDKEAIEKSIWGAMDAAGERPNGRKVSDVAAALRALPGVLVEADDIPAWLDGRTGADPDEALVCQTGILSLGNGKLSPHSPSFFSSCVSAAAWDPGAGCPTWDAFLKEIFSGDSEQIETLQDWFGYCLSRRTDYQKMLLLTGPRRSGKGTIANVLSALVGPGDFAGVRIFDLAGRFCLGSFADKKIAILSDARIGSRADAAALTELLLTTSGGDTVTVERKFREPLTRKVTARITLISNEVPGFLDSGGAVASRFVFLETKRSFEGVEDPGLLEKLRRELPGILRWAVAGYHRLRVSRRFIQPTSTAGLADVMRNLGSPVTQWVAERAEIVTDGRWECKEAFTDWRGWAEATGHFPGNEGTFGRNLHAAFPQVEKVRGRVGTERIHHYVGIRPI